MEQVWKDIHQTSIQENNPKMLFEDLLHRPPIEFEAKGNNNNIINANDGDDDDDDKNGIFKREFLMSSVISTPVFMSSLNSPFETLATNNINTTVVASTNNSSVTSFLNSSCFPDITNNKRPLSEHHHDLIDGETGVDRRHKRMIKNRESAARSRARRQAYTSELERERDELKEENAMLRKQQEQLLLSTPAQEPKKRTHIRSYTAPF